jgi:hypothetical protein
MARSPSAPCTKIAKGPRRRHSPFSGSGGGCADADGGAKGEEEEVGKGMSTPRERREVAIVWMAKTAVSVEVARRVGARPGGGSI